MLYIDFSGTFVESMTYPILLFVPMFHVQCFVLVSFCPSGFSTSLCIPSHKLQSFKHSPSMSRQTFVSPHIKAMTVILSLIIKKLR